MSNNSQRHIVNFQKYLIGKTISKIRYLTDEEMELFGWYKRPMVIVLNDDTQIVLQSDDEGNDGGAAFLYNGEQDIQETIYTI
jgi:hypothetical protein